MKYFEDKVTELSELIEVQGRDKKSVEKFLRGIAKDQRLHSAKAINYWYWDDDTPTDEKLIKHVLKCEVTDHENWGALTAIDKNLQGLMDLGTCTVDELQKEIDNDIRQ